MSEKPEDIKLYEKDLMNQFIFVRQQESHSGMLKQHIRLAGGISGDFLTTSVFGSFCLFVL